MNRLMKRDRFAGYLTPLLIILSSVLFTTALLLAIGVNPWTTYSSLVDGAFGSQLGIINTLTKSVPICLAALGVAIARHAGIFNIGINGQIAFGGIGAVLVGVYVKGLPAIIHIPLCLLGGMLMGMLFSLLPTVLYMKRKVNLIVVFLLMNNIAVKLTTWVIYSHIKDPDSMATASYRIQESAKLPNLILKPAKLNIGILIALGVSALMYIFFYKMTSGFELRACGNNRLTAEYSGIKAGRYLVASLLIGGAIAGLAGGIEVLGTYHRLYDGFDPGYGFDGIPIALLSNGNPVGIIVGSVLFGALRVGSANMQVKAGVSSELVSVIQGVLISFIAMEYIFHFFSEKLLAFRPFRSMKKELVEK